MKPQDHPDFFRLPPPDGRSRESTLRLDANGHFWHDGRRVAHPRLALALATWVGRHPDDGRFVLSNGYDWTYLAVDDAPFFVERVKIEPNRIVLRLSDGTEEGWNPRETRVGPQGALYTLVKRPAEEGSPLANRGVLRRLGGQGPFEARFTRHAQTSLAPALATADDIVSGAKSSLGTGVGAVIGGKVVPIGG